MILFHRPQEYRVFCKKLEEKTDIAGSPFTTKEKKYTLTGLEPKQTYIVQIESVFPDKMADKRLSEEKSFETRGKSVLKSYDLLLDDDSLQKRP